MDAILSLLLTGIGLTGLAALLAITCVVFWQYRDSRVQSFRWRWRNIRLKQLSALACLFCFAMAASYGVLQEVWGVFYLLLGLKTGIWWARFAFNQY